MESDASFEEESRDEQVRNKADVLSSFVLHAPPGEFHEVLNDIKAFAQDDEGTQEKVSSVFPKYTKSQLTPVQLEGAEHKVILSEFNHLPDGRFIDPRTQQSFVYDYVHSTVIDLNPWEPDAIAEQWRSALDTEWTHYSSEHYHEGAASVFATSTPLSTSPPTKDNNNLTDTYNANANITLNACLEGHQFQPKKFWNGRWRSIWSVTFNPSKDKRVELKGLIKLHVHYYEDGNVQLVSKRHCDETINVSTPQQFACDIVNAVQKLENGYQRAISENYQTMSDTTFKALRRPLPVIRSKMEWNKLMGYKIGSELKNLY